MKWFRPVGIGFVLGQLLAPPALAQVPSQLDYKQPLQQSAVASVQQRLKQAGTYAGRTDGVWASDGAAALRRFQRLQGLQVTGQLNPATVATLGLNALELLHSPTSAAVPPIATSSGTSSATASPHAPLNQSDEPTVRLVQSRLAKLGLYSGQIDGHWTPVVQDAVKELQRRHGFESNGELNEQTVVALSDQSIPSPRNY